MEQQVEFDPPNTQSLVQHFDYFTFGKSYNTAYHRQNSYINHCFGITILEENFKGTLRNGLPKGPILIWRYRQVS